MKRGEQALYVGKVVHRRVSPVRHKLQYQVFAVLLECGRLGELDRKLRLFSHNRFNLISIHDKDHGDGKALEAYLRALANDAGLSAKVDRFVMLCYPRVLGYAFNPLTTYFGLDTASGIVLTVYEVNNTFGERASYVIPAKQNGEGLVHQTCTKELYVSPFNHVAGRYSFQITPLDQSLTLGVAFSDASGPRLLAFFRGKRRPLSDANLLRALLMTGWMTVNVIAGIHWEALKLWLKGLRVVPRPHVPKQQVVFPSSRQGSVEPGLGQT